MQQVLRAGGGDRDYQRLSPVSGSAPRAEDIEQGMGTSTGDLEHGGPCSVAWDHDTQMRSLSAPASGHVGSLPARQESLRSPNAGSSRGPSEESPQQQENHSRFAVMLLEILRPVMTCVGLLILIFFVGGFFVYVQGWVVLHNTYMAPCDQPLQWWLLFMQSLPFLRGAVLGAVVGQEQSIGKFHKLFNWIIFVGFACGVLMYMQCHTCGDTNPELFSFMKLYLIYRISTSLISIFMACGVVSGVAWLRHTGLLESGPGPHAAAREGLVGDIETVAFDPKQGMADEDGSADSSQCPICFEDFEAGALIKRTPCRHHFHEECLGKWLSEYGKICPLCRNDLQEAIDSKRGSPGDGTAGSAPPVAGLPFRADPVLPGAAGQGAAGSLGVGFLSV